jgi:hypothetical protein
MPRARNNTSESGQTTTSRPDDEASRRKRRKTLVSEVAHTLDICCADKHCYGMKRACDRSVLCRDFDMMPQAEYACLRRCREKKLRFVLALTGIQCLAGVHLLSDASIQDSMKDPNALRVSRLVKGGDMPSLKEYHS